MRKIGLSILLFVFLIPFAQSKESLQDTVSYTLADLEANFFKNNLLLLASKYNIEATRAEIVQSKLWNNPTLALEQNIYNKYTGKAFDVGKTGQNIVQVQQLILLAGKRNKRINLSEINSQIAEYQFYDVLRTLKYELRSTFFDTYYLMQTIKMYDDEIASLERTIEIFNILISKSAISMKEVIRIKALLFTLESERLGILNQVYQNQGTLNTLLNNVTPQFIFPNINKQTIDSLKISLPNLLSLQDTAFSKRMDLKVYESDIRFQEANIAYQKALAVPDVRVGYLYDRAGSYIQNYNAVTLQIDLPFSNRNQGNIAMAKNRREESVALHAQYKNKLVSEIYEAYQKVKETDRIYETIDKSVSSDFDELVDIIIKNYEKRNISLLEFIDYYQAYKTSMLHIIKLKSDRVQAVEQLNFFTGKNLLEF
jgi:cobalt-zinc-cadmium efflux system outer membrane protein